MYQVISERQIETSENYKELGVIVKAKLFRTVDRFCDQWHEMFQVSQLQQRLSDKRLAFCVTWIYAGIRSKAKFVELLIF